MRAYAGLVFALLALFGGGCAASGRGVAADAAPAAAFIAPDGARATPNTGASRLADGAGSGIEGPASPAAATGATPAAASAGGPEATGDGVVFTYVGGGSSMNLAGDFNAWSADADPMAKQADGSFRLVKKLEPGRYAYKFVIDGQWQADPQAKETVDDGFGGKNSVVVVGPGARAAGPTATGAAAGTPLATAADGAVFTFTGPGSSVNVAGEFNNWDMASDPMAKQADGTFRLVKKLEPGRYAYKFVVDGQWMADPKVTESVDDGFGGKNSVIVVGSGTAGAAGTGSTAAPAAPPAPAPAAGATGRGRPPEFTPDGMRFTFAGAARSVHLAGDFNEWSLTGDPLTRGADGTWTIVKKLPAGSHAYKFVVDSTTWKTDEANPARTDDGFGGKNSIVTVP